MLVFFKRLPQGVGKKDVEDLISPVARGGLFSPKGKIKTISIIERPNPQLNAMDYHAVVNIESDRVAEKVIKKLKMKIFNGKYIEIRRYYVRNAANDPRNKNRLLDDVPDSRRKWDRRQIVEK